jgi:hypothetical protein
VALRMCVKEIAPAPKEMTPHTWVAAKKNAYNDGGGGGPSEGGEEL